MSPHSPPRACGCSSSCWGSRSPPTHSFTAGSFSCAPPAPALTPSPRFCPLFQVCAWHPCHVAHGDTPCFWGSTTPDCLLVEGTINVTPWETNHLNPKVSASWQPAQRPSPQEMKQTLSLEFPCFFSLKFPGATRLQLRGRIKATTCLWGCWDQRSFGLFNCLLPMTCYANGFFVPLGVQVPEWRFTVGRHISVGGRTFHSA